MKHLHASFVLASFALGLGVVFLLGAMWNVHDLPLAGAIPWNVMSSALFCTAAGLVLVVYGYHGIRQEIYATS